MAPKEVVVALENLRDVECVILLHFLFHQVLHNARVESVAGLLVRCVLIFRVVQQCLARLWRVLVKLTRARHLATRFVLAGRQLGSIWQWHVRARLRLILTRATNLWDLVDQDNFRQLRSVLETLEFGVKELGPCFNDLINQLRFLRNVVTRSGGAWP